MRGDDLAIIKSQLGYAIEVQFKEMHPISARSGRSNAWHLNDSSAR
ncbi:hypothetical protein LMG28690_02476 [Paraburkholderia caffeinilytica]|nr:hypothetical protein LMG28690_02476 [Paraburkholderia caffeinilytica]